MSEKFQWHTSALLMNEGCGEQFRRRYLEGERLLPGVAATVGTAVDRTVHADLAEKMAGRELLDDLAVADLAFENLAGAWDKYGVTLAAEDAIAGPAKVKGAAIDKSIRLAQLHHRRVAPTVMPTHLHQKFVLDFNGYDFQLAGEIDIREVDTIRDVKTAGKSPDAGAAERSLQLDAYALAVQAETGHPPRRGVLDFLVDTKLLQVVQPERSFEKADFGPFLARLQVAEKARQKGVFVPARPDDGAGRVNWRCTPKWCGYFQTCRYALRPVSISLVNIETAPVVDLTKALEAPDAEPWRA